MQYKRLLLLALLCPLVLLSFAQNHKTTVKGTIKDATGNPITGAAVKLKNTRHGAVTNHLGFFLIETNITGEAILEIKAVGFVSQEKTIQLTAQQTQTIDFIVANDVHDIDEVSVIGRSSVAAVNKQAYNVTAIDAKKLYNTTLDLAHTLDRVSGVRIREAGGVGSRMEFSLNGFTGRQVKFFLDGVPMDNFGSSFQLNNIPINLAERVEVYKGVVPVWLGSDALGGAVNIVTSNAKKSYVDVSYSYGSFNTHRTTINTGYTSESGFTVQLNAFQNYSDNDYKVRVDVSDLKTGAYYPKQWVKRFHDTYHNETIIANIGVVGKRYADKLLLGVTLGHNYAEIQTGARMVSVFGDWHRKGNIVMPTLKYAVKDLFVKGLQLNVNANYNLGSEQNIDTVNRRYNWFQQYIQKEGPGAERERSMYKFRNHNGLASASLNYQINDKHSLALNNVFNTFSRSGKDELYPNDEKYDQPKKVRKNILGLGYRYAYNEKWNTTAFTKYYTQFNSYSQSYNPSGGWGDVAYQNQSTSYDKLGYGIATTYFVLHNLQLKASYEKSYRLPETEELFGDVLNLEGNINLKPESSNNYNFGVNFQPSINRIHNFSIDANFLVRNAKDFIRPSLNANQTKQINSNLGAATNVAVDAELRYSYRQLFTAGVNMTYQNLRNNQKYDENMTIVSPTYRDRIPNMPYLFGNADASLFFKNVMAKGNNLTLGYNILYVHAYYLSWPGQGTTSSKLDIPRQWCQDVNMVYTLGNGKYNVAVECKNIVNNKLYDNFTLQKPGRAFYLKLRYFISR